VSKRRFIEKLSTWRKVALSAWGPPRDPTAYGTLDLDCEEALAYLAALKKETGESISLTHLTGKAIALAIAESPEVNAFVARGKLALRDSVDVFFQVAFFDEHEEKSTALKTTRKDANLAGAKVAHADEKTLVEIAKELRGRATAIRKKSDAETAKAARAMASLPGSLVGLATRAGAYLSYDYNMNLSRFGIPYDAFGSVMVTNIGSFGIPVGYAPLLELSRVPLVLTLGVIRDAPSVHEGKLCIRKRVTIGVAFDHRVMDGYHAGVMAKTFMRIMEDPASQLR
jgi:pyruvate/2-oxoglutarate dehydrogenase complex dihydrolipoamide acyltransferase (E2) component